MSYGGHGTSGAVAPAGREDILIPSDAANQFISIYNILYTGKLLKRVVIMQVPHPAARFAPPPLTRAIPQPHSRRSSL